MRRQARSRSPAPLGYPHLVASARGRVDLVPPKRGRVGFGSVAGNGRITWESGGGDKRVIWSRGEFGSVGYCLRGRLIPLRVSITCLVDAFASAILI